MDSISLIIALPKDLLYLVSNYDPSIFSIFPESEMIKHDWFQLMKKNFSREYSKTESSNHSLMKIYFEFCLKKSKTLFTTYYAIIRLTDGTLMSCGLNYRGQLDSADIKNRNKFEIIKGIPKDLADIACGCDHTIIQLIDGTLMSYGLNHDGQLGHCDNIRRNKFKIIKQIPKNIVEISCGGYHTIIRLTDGTLMSCGLNSDGQLGYGDDENRNKFEIIKDIPKNILEISCGNFHTMIRLTDGTLMSSGLNREGQLGHGDNQNRNKFEIIKETPKNIAEISCGPDHTIIRLTDGTLMSCGMNASGQLGHGDNENRNKFEIIKEIPRNIAEISCGAFVTIIKLTDGTLMSTGNWGNRNKFERMADTPENISEISCGGDFIIIRLADGTLMSHGEITEGHLYVENYDPINKFELIKNIAGNALINC
ncbi:MAG: chromosome condensation regulator [Hyperionvirus sp.]|uniref:Chromosome condensation regulator n=1 Tax=Hyperionvirus sp. TaxID=2487770 RepID=A0A3G5A6V3_9VIRU|nr:MAG: chromosome condensation regulator [Hyperionvirus sp.]